MSIETRKRVSNMVVETIMWTTWASGKKFPTERIEDARIHKTEIEPETNFVIF